MSEIQRSRPGLFLSVSMAILLGMTSTGFAQGTKAAPSPAKSKAKAGEAAKAKAGDSIDLNSATTEELATLPGIGEANARKIVEGRPFATVGDLTRSGIPASTIEKLKPLVVVSPLPDPVNINTGTAEELQTLPGVGPAMAKAIIEGRPFAEYKDLEKVKGIGPKKVDEFRGRLKFGTTESATKPAEPSRAKAAPKTAVAKEKMKEAEPAKGKTAKTSTDRPKLAPGAKINLNTASKEQLDLLPGIGEFYAQAIIDARPFSKVEDIMKIKGIKEVEFNKIKDVITVK